MRLPCVNKLTQMIAIKHFFLTIFIDLASTPLLECASRMESECRRKLSAAISHVGAPRSSRSYRVQFRERVKGLS